jgi:hypothetical protein
MLRLVVLEHLPAGNVRRTHASAATMPALYGDLELAYKTLPRELLRTGGLLEERGIADRGHACFLATSFAASAASIASVRRSRIAAVICFAS